MVEVEDVFEYDNDDDHISSMGADIGSVAATGLAVSGTALSITAAVEIFYGYVFSGDATGINLSLFGSRSEAAIVRNALDAVDEKLKGEKTKTDVSKNSTSALEKSVDSIRSDISDMDLY